MRVAVIGASLGGLASANVFHRLGHDVDVFEKAQSGYADKGAGLGYCDVSLWEELRGKPMIRRGSRAHRSQGCFYYGDLWAYLYSGLPSGTVRFGMTVQELGKDVERPTINGVTYDLVILADGGWSKLRRYVTDTQPEYRGHVMWGGQVDAAELPDFHSFGRFQGRRIKNSPFGGIFLPCTTDSGRDFLVGGFVVPTPLAEAHRPTGGANRHATALKNGEGRVGVDVPSWLLPLFRQTMGQHAQGELVRLFEAFATKGKLVPRPQWDYAARQVTAGRIVLVGDAAHMASPATASGAHTAVLDAMALREAFATCTNIDLALRTYSRGGIGRAQQLHKRSRMITQRFIPAGGLAALPSPSSLVAGAPAVQR